MNIAEEEAGSIGNGILSSMERPPDFDESQEYGRRAPRKSRVAKPGRKSHVTNDVDCAEVVPTAQGDRAGGKHEAFPPKETLSTAPGWPSHKRPQGDEPDGPGCRRVVEGKPFHRWTPQAMAGPLPGNPEGADSPDGHDGQRVPSGRLPAEAISFQVTGQPWGQEVARSSPRPPRQGIGRGRSDSAEHGTSRLGNAPVDGSSESSPQVEREPAPRASDHIVVSPRVAATDQRPAAAESKTSRTNGKEEVYTRDVRPRTASGSSRRRCRETTARNFDDGPGLCVPDDRECDSDREDERERTSGGTGGSVPSLSRTKEGPQAPGEGEISAGDSRRRRGKPRPRSSDCLRAEKEEGVAGEAHRGFRWKSGFIPRKDGRTDPSEGRPWSGPARDTRIAPWRSSGSDPSYPCWRQPTAKDPEMLAFKGFEPYYVDAREVRETLGRRVPGNCSAMCRSADARPLDTTKTLGTSWPTIPPIEFAAA